MRVDLGAWCVSLLSAVERICWLLPGAPFRFDMYIFTSPICEQGAYSFLLSHPLSLGTRSIPFKGYPWDRSKRCGIGHGAILGLYRHKSTNYENDLRLRFEGPCVHSRQSRQHRLRKYFLNGPGVDNSYKGYSRIRTRSARGVFLCS